MSGERVAFQSSRDEISEGIVLYALAGSPSAEEFDDFLDGVARFLRSVQRRGEMVSLVLDPSALTRFDASMRQAYGHWRAANRTLIRQSCARAAYVTESALWRGIMTAVFWIAPPAVVVQTFGEREAAIEWVRSQRAGASTAVRQD